MPKRYLYVDETGQDTGGRIFIVACVLVTEIESLSASIEAIEQKSGKSISKWGKTRPNIRMAFMREVIKLPSLVASLHFVVFRDSKDNEEMTLQAIAKTLGARPSQTKTRVYVDALSKVKRREYAQRLRQKGIQTDEVRGVQREENNSLIRLADAVAGFVRDALEDGNDDEKKLFTAAINQGCLIDIK